MNRLLPSFLVSLAATGCSVGGPGIGPPQPPWPAVSNLRVVPEHRALTLIWDVDRSGDPLFSGFHIYIAERPVVGTPDEQALLALVRPVNRLPYPGDTDPDLSRETYVATDLENGVRYYCFVRPLGTDGRPGRPTNEVMAICRPGGDAVLQPIFSGAYDGFDFSTGRHVDADAVDCDLAYYVKDGHHRLIAPARIDPLLNATRFWDAGSPASFADLTGFDVRTEGAIEISVRAGGVYVFRTAQDHYGKLRVNAVADSGGQPTVHFSYVHQSIPNLIDLR